jgi:hypothetical protein
VLIINLCILLGYANTAVSKHPTYCFNSYTIVQHYRRYKCSSSGVGREILVDTTQVGYFLQVRVRFLDFIRWKHVVTRGSFITLVILLDDLEREQETMVSVSIGPFSPW